MQADTTIVPIRDVASSDETPTKNIRPEAEISFQNLTYTVKTKPSTQNTAEKGGFFSRKKFKPVKKVILSNLTATFQPGTLTAILGPSGSGKTSLLNLLSGRISGGKIEGNIWLNGRKADDGALRLVSRYISQDDVMLPTMTVREVLEMAIRFRVKGISNEELGSRVQNALATLKLEKAENTLIGDSINKGISGGERKRTAIAMEMATDSSILLLDEPTSGLDIFTSILVVNMLREIARAGQTVICVIHQPSSDIFDMFDNVMVLNNGGIVYSGPQKQLVSYFSSIGYECSTFTNPADFVFTTVLNENPLAQTDSNSNDELLKEQRAQLTEKLVSTWTSSPQFEVLEKSVNVPRLSPVTSSFFTSTIPISDQFKYLAKRAFNNMTRNKLMVRVRLAQTVMIGLILGIVFYKSNTKRPSVRIQNYSGASFFATVSQFMPVAINVLSTFSTEKQVFQREHQNGYYKLAPYFFSKIMCELPTQVIYPIIFSAVSYYMVGFNSSFSHFLIHCAGMIMVSLNAFAIGLFVSCFFDDIAVALSFLPLVLIIPMIFSGFLVNSGSVPAWIAWLQWVSPIKYGFTIIITNQLKNLEVGGVPIGNNQLDILDLGPFGIGGSIGFLAMFFVIFMIMAYRGLSKVVLNSSRLGSKSKTDSQKKAILMGPPDEKFGKTQ